MLGGKATGSLLVGKVEVARDAQKTDGEQSLKGLLLDRGATINAKPELEIFADDVKCAHGATVGELDRNAALLRRQPRPRPGEAHGAAARAFVAGLWDDSTATSRASPTLARADAGRWSHEHPDAASTRALDLRDEFPAIPRGLGTISTAPRPRRSRRR